MLSQLSGFMSKLRKPTYDDDTIDRLNYVYTNIIIIACALTTMAKSYVGEPLQCWVPAQFKGGWEEYVENYCFVENTYWLPMSKRPSSIGVEERGQRELKYYQWVPLVLAIQALLFYLPRLIWRTLNWQTGLQVTALVRSAFITTKSGDSRVLRTDLADGVVTIAKHFNAALDFQKGMKDQADQPLSRAFRHCAGVYLTVVYLFVKLLFVVNLVLQFIILNWFLGPNYAWWGVEILRDLLYGIEWESSGHFPRVTLCDFEVRRLGNVHRFTVQCVLMLNMFNEKIFIFLWWWFLICLVLTVINLVYWLVLAVNGRSRVNFVKKYLVYKQRIKSSNMADQNAVSRFVAHRLQPDGVFVLRLISDNAGDIAVAEIVDYMWHVHQTEHQQSAKITE